MFQEIINNSKQDFEKAISNFKKEMLTIQTGRVNPIMVEEIKIETYGSKIPLKQVASISIPEPRTIEIRPWDKSLVHQIENEIRIQRPNFPVAVNGDVLRINFPALTEEEREKLTKIVGKMTEEARIKVRQIRSEVWDKIQDLEKEKVITEDDKFRAKDELQKVVDDYNDQINELKEKKDGEIMKI